MRHSRPSLSRRCQRPPAARAAFTLVEMLIVIGVIIILLSLLIVALNMAAKAAQRAHTQSLMTAIAQGLVRFKDDIGYHPPVLVGNSDTDDAQYLRKLWEGPIPGSSSYNEDIQDWYSWTSLAEYLIGYDEGRYDGYGDGPSTVYPGSEDELPPTGIRHPGPDGVWGAGRDGLLIDRDPVPPSSGGPARVYGPYLQLEDASLLGALVQEAGEWVVRFPGEAAYDEDAPKVITDYWGEPISYYRRNYPPGALTQSYRPIDYNDDGVPDRVPTLSDVFCLRSFAVDVGAAADSTIPDESGDTTTVYRLESAEFALLSLGPDRDAHREYRRDPEELNRDNIVEVGP
jgi:type II secretory pathway pseudopilin PulG